MTVVTSPPGQVVIVDGSSVTTPQVFAWTPNSAHTLDVTTPQGTGSTRYAFDHWSQGGSKSQTITAPATATTYTAFLNAQYQLTTATTPTSGGTLTASPTSADVYYTDGSQVRLTATAASSYTFTNFSGDLTGATNPQTFTLSSPKSVTANFTANQVSTKITISSNPPGRTSLVDGTPATTPTDFSWTLASTHTLDIQTPQGVGFTRYTATFDTQQLLSTNVSPANAGTLTASPTSPDGFYTQGTQVRLTATPATGFTFANFTGDLTGSTNPQTLTLSSPKSVTANFSAPPLTVSPTSLPNLTSSNPSATLDISGGTSGQNVIVGVDSPWLQVTPSRGTTPFTVNITAVSTSLAPGTYSANVLIGNAGLQVPVTFQVNASSTAQLISLPLNVTLNFYQGQPTPAPQTVNITSSDGLVVKFTTAVTYPSGTRSWVGPIARSGQTPLPLSIGITVPALGQTGVYKATLTISATGLADLSIPLTLNYLTLPPPKISVDTQELTLSSVGEVKNTSIVVKNSGGGLIFNATPQPDGGGTWLRVSPTPSSSSVDQPSVLQVTSDPTGLATGTYTGYITISASGSDTRSCSQSRRPATPPSSNPPSLD